MTQWAVLLWMIKAPYKVFVRTQFQSSWKKLKAFASFVTIDYHLLDWIAEMFFDLFTFQNVFLNLGGVRTTILTQNTWKVGKIEGKIVNYDGIYFIFTLSISSD